MPVTAEDVTFVARLVDELCGVVLDDSKGYLVESRLGQLAREAGCPSYRDLCDKARRESDRLLQQKIIDAITTQETLFFRDDSPFEALRHRVLPDLIDARTRNGSPRRLRLWSAACSTGQEPYSLAIVLHEMLPDLRTWDVNILATDISDAAVAQASRGHYANHEVRRGMPPASLPKYFHQEPNGWRVKDELRVLVAFRRLNLVDSLAALGPFDVVFCRNVAIYFDTETRKNVFSRIAERLAPNGYLLVGSSESLTDLASHFEAQQHCRCVFYRPRRRGPAALRTIDAARPAPPQTQPASSPPRSTIALAAARR